MLFQRISRSSNYRFFIILFTKTRHRHLNSFSISVRTYNNARSKKFKNYFPLNNKSHDELSASSIVKDVNVNIIFKKLREETRKACSFIVKKIINFN